MDFESLLKDSGVDAIILLNEIERNDSNFIYLTKQRDMDALALISEKPILYVSPLEIGNVKDSEFEIKPMTKEMFNEINSKLKGKKIGLNYDYVTVNGLERLKKNLKNIEFVDVSPILEKKRMVKSEEEIKIIQEACAITDEVLAKVFSEAQNCKTEIELRDFIETIMKEYNVKPSFPTIVASGMNSAVPHHVPDDTKLKGFTVLDLGVIYKNYCSDISRTVYFGKPSNDEKENYVKVLKIKEECTDMIKEGIKFKEIHDYANNQLDGKFLHLIGHGLGIDVHESPMVEGTLKENMVITIEPGIYLEDKYGIRIEDDIVVKDKPLVLNKTTKELITIN